MTSSQLPTGTLAGVTVPSTPLIDAALSYAKAQTYYRFQVKADL